MTDMLFDPPWWVPALIALVGIAVFVSGNRRQKWQARNVGAGIVAAAIIFGFVAYLVDTPTEAAVRKTRQLVAAFAARDAAGMRPILEPETAVVDSRNHIAFAGRDRIVFAAMAAAELYGLRSVTIISTTADQTQTVINIDLTVLLTSTRDRGGTGHVRVVWEQRQDGWHLTQIQLLQFDGRDPSDYLDRLPRLP